MKSLEPAALLDESRPSKSDGKVLLECFCEWLLPVCFCVCVCVCPVFVFVLAQSIHLEKAHVFMYFDKFLKF